VLGDAKPFPNGVRRLHVFVVKNFNANGTIVIV